MEATEKARDDIDIVISVIVPTSLACEKKIWFIASFGVMRVAGL